jgi:quinohemoprotein ethanol dehydrogenase
LKRTTPSALQRRWIAVVPVVLAACSPQAPPAVRSFADVSDQRLIQAGSEPSQWLTYGGTYEEQRYSQLAQITKDNVGELGLVWFADYDTNLQQESTPLFIDGVLYVSTAWSKVYAFDATTGEELWNTTRRSPASGHGTLLRCRESGYRRVRR